MFGTLCKTWTTLRVDCRWNKVGLPALLCTLALNWIWIWWAVSSRKNRDLGIGDLTYLLVEFVPRWNLVHLVTEDQKSEWSIFYPSCQTGLSGIWHHKYKGKTVEWEIRSTLSKYGPATSLSKSTTLNSGEKPCCTWVWLYNSLIIIVWLYNIYI